MGVTILALYVVEHVQSFSKFSLWKQNHKTRKRQKDFQGESKVFQNQLNPLFRFYELHIFTWDFCDNIVNKIQSILFSLMSVVIAELS